MTKYDGTTQLRTLYLLKLFIEKRGQPPTLQQLGDLRGLTDSAMLQHLKYLAERGYIIRRKGWINIQLTEKGWAS